MASFWTGHALGYPQFHGKLWELTFQPHSDDCKDILPQGYGEKMVCITIPKDQRTAGRMSTPSYHPIRMIKITFTASLPLWKHLFWQLQCLHFCTAVRESQSQLTAPFFLPLSASNDCVIEETKCYPNTCVPCGDVIAIHQQHTAFLPVCLRCLVSVWQNAANIL